MLGSYHNYENQPRMSKSVAFGAIALLALVAVFAGVALKTPRLGSLPFHVAQVTLEQQEFEDFISRYSKSYSSQEEYDRRFQAYQDNAAFIRVFNSGSNSFTLGINEFADLTLKEFQERYLPYKITRTSPNHEEYVSTFEAPSSIDWVSKGAVTSVKNQEQCGSCWSFSAAGSIEGAWKLSGHTLVSLSTQQLVDCSGSYGNQGCNGGLMDDAFKYVIAHGLTSYTNYPYKAADGSCNQSKVKDVVATISSYKDVTADNSQALVDAIAQQPVSVAVDAANLAWQFYTGGTVDGLCGDSLDHGVLAVGYDESASDPYYKVKNSWGSSWGLDGYIRLKIKDGKGTCGIQMSASYPIV